MGIASYLSSLPARLDKQGRGKFSYRLSFKRFLTAQIGSGANLIWRETSEYVEVMAVGDNCVILKANNRKYYIVPLPSDRLIFEEEIREETDNPQG